MSTIPLPKPPKIPTSRLVKEGTYGTCPVCRSTEIHKYNLFNFAIGKVLGCINPDCNRYYKGKLETKSEKKYRIVEKTYNDGKIYFIPEYYDSVDNDWIPTNRIMAYLTYDDALKAINKYKELIDISKRYITEEKIHNIE